MFKKNDTLFYSIYQKLLNKENISKQDALLLFQSNEIHKLSLLSNHEKEKTFGKKVYYLYNRHLNYSNVCILKCSFCSFRRSKNSPGAYTMSLENVEERLNSLNANQLQEIHIVGGLHPQLDFSYYEELLSFIKEKYPHIHLKAFTAVEIDFFVEKTKLPIDKLLLRLKEKGLDSLTGGGAEIFNESVRKKICQHKTDADQWLKIHKIAHELEIPSTATMMFGHIESYEDRIDHLNRLRNLQEESPGFLCFIPLTYHPDHNTLGCERTSVLDELKTIAISKIYLNNILIHKVYWIMLGIKTAQMALEFGSNDLDGTIIEEKIYHEAGALTPQFLNESRLRSIIEEAQKIPVKRNSLYQEIDSIA